MVTELEEARQKRNQKQLADTVMENLGVTAEALATITDSAPDEIRSAKKLLLAK